jgi:hypothetical protein
MASRPVVGYWAKQFPETTQYSIKTKYTSKNQSVIVGPITSGSHACVAVHTAAAPMILDIGAMLAEVISVGERVHPSATGSRSSRKKICTKLECGSVL